MSKKHFIKKKKKNYGEAKKCFIIKRQKNLIKKPHKESKKVIYQGT